MAHFANLVHAFNGGELSPRMEGRSDLAAYSAGARRMENLIPLVQGPAIRRSGSHFVAEVKFPDQPTFLIPFTVSTEASYIIEVGQAYFRFYTQEARLEDPPGTPVEVVTPYLAGELEDVRWAQSADTLFLVHPNHAPQQLTRTTATSFAIAAVDFVDGPYLDFGDPTTIMTPSGTTGSITISASQVTGINDDQGFLVGQDEGRLIQLEISDEVGYATITAVNSTTNVDATVVRDFAATSGSVEWRLGVYYTDNYPRTVSFHEQRLWFAGAPDFIQRVDGSVTGDFTRFSPSGSVTDSTGPWTGDDVFADNSISYTASANELNAILWLRVVRTMLLGTSGSIFNMRASSNNEALTPVNVNLTEDDHTGSSFVQPVLLGNALFYLGRVDRRLYSTTYSLEVDGIQSADVTEFADHILATGGRRLAVAQQPHSLIWVVCENGDLVSLTFRPTQRTAAWARHPIGGAWPGRDSAVVESIAVAAVADEDQPWIVVKRKIDGSTARYIEFIEESFRFLDTEQEIEDAFFVDSGLTFDGDATGDPNAISGATQANPVVLTITGHPYLDGDEIRITKVVGMSELNQRSFTVANKATNTLELQGEDGTGYTAYESGGDVRKKAATLTGLGHLEGETVQILADGSSVADQVVSSGQITLDSTVSRAHIGLQADAIFESLPLEVPDPERGAQGKLKVYNSATLRMHNSMSGEIGPSESNLVPILFRSSEDAMGIPLSPFTGDKRVTFPGGWDREGVFLFRSAAPFPVTLVLLNLYGKGGAR